MFTSEANSEVLMILYEVLTEIWVEMYHVSVYSGGIC